MPIITPLKLNIFDITKNLLQTSIDRWGEFKKIYNSWIINKALFQYDELVLLVNEVNKMTLTPEQEYYFYLYAIPNKYRKYPGWVKTEKFPEETELIAKHYKINYKKAYEYYQLMSKEQYKSLKNHYELGGLIKKRKFKL